MWSVAAEQAPDRVNHSGQRWQNRDRLGFFGSGGPDEGERRLGRLALGVDSADIDVIPLGGHQLDACGDRSRERGVDYEGERPGLDRVIPGVDGYHEPIRLFRAISAEVVCQLEVSACA